MPQSIVAFLSIIIFKSQVYSIDMTIFNRSISKIKRIVDEINDRRKKKFRNRNGFSLILSIHSYFQNSSLKEIT